MRKPIWKFNLVLHTHRTHIQSLRRHLEAGRPSEAHAIFYSDKTANVLSRRHRKDTWSATWLQHMVLKQQADKSLAVLDSGKRSTIVT